MPSNLRRTTRECVHIVTPSHFRLRDKDGGLIRHSLKYHAARTLHGYYA